MRKVIGSGHRGYGEPLEQYEDEARDVPWRVVGRAPAGGDDPLDAFTPVVERVALVVVFECLGRDQYRRRGQGPERPVAGDESHEAHEQFFDCAMRPLIECDGPVGAAGIASGGADRVE